MKIPKNYNTQTTTFEDALVDLLNSIAQQESAMSKLINSEAKKNNTFTGDHLNFPTTPSNEEIIQYCQSVHHIVDSIFMKEWLLLKKLEMILLSIDTYQVDSKEKDKAEKLL